MIITTQITKDYYEKAKHYGFMDSILKHWGDDFQIGTIDFSLHENSYDMPLNEIKTYRKDYPKNRPFFVCPQGGEFIDFMTNVSDDEVIINLDADCVMQRSMTPEELNELQPGPNEIICTYPALPPQKLKDVATGLKFKNTDKFDADILENYEFCGAFLCATAGTFRKLRNLVVDKFDDLVEVNTHHAGIQFLISYLSHKYLDVRVVSSKYQIGEWYSANGSLSVREKQLLFKNETVIFNHTKFQRNFNY